MKVKIGKYKSYFGPYQLADALCFWAKKTQDEYGTWNKPEWVTKFGEILAFGRVIKDDDNPFPKSAPTPTFISNFFSWLDTKRKRKVYVRIDKWDTWSMDDTLALIILPMLKQLKETKHGAPCVDYKDVPEELRPTKKEIADYKKTGNTDPNFFKRWDYVLDEMIFAFEHIVDESWEQEFYSGEFDIRSEPCDWDDDGKPKLYQMVEGRNHTYKCDYEGLKQVQDRIQRGTEFFGKYYQNLWD